MNTRLAFFCLLCYAAVIIDTILLIPHVLSYQQHEVSMNKKDLNFFKKYLEKRMGELLSQADDTVSGMNSSAETFPDPTDRASLEADRNFTLRIRDREAKLIKKIRQALEQIENGTYGICESCGEEISVKRLKARPVTTQCIECKAKEEALEKALGI
jgi:DnaK suppressor protein